MLPLLHSESAPAATASGFPKRLITVTWPNGVIADDFYPSGSTLSFGQTLKALEPFKSKILMPVGLDQTVVLDAAGGREYDGHFTYPSLLTGMAEQKSEGRTGEGPSLDQVISDEIAKKAQLTAPVLHLGVQSEGDGNPTSWRAAGQMNKAEIDPAQVFNRLFASAALPVGQIDTLKQRRQSVLDYLKKDITGFSRLLGTADRLKIEAHLASIRDLENQLKTMAPPAASSCTKPATPAASNEDTPALMKAMFDLAAVAIKCDLTRVITIDLYDDGGADGNNFPWLGVSSDYHKVAHAGSSQASDKIKIDAWIVSFVAGLATQLEMTQEAGGTALDHSVIVTLNDMNDGADHYVGKIPFVLIGTCGGYFKSGGIVQRYSKTPHNKLLATLGNAMDLPMTGFGDPKYAGTLSELVA
jgi:hypothetical protein